MAVLIMPNGLLSLRPKIDLRQKCLCPTLSQPSYFTGELVYDLKRLCSRDAHSSSSLFSLDYFKKFWRKGRSDEIEAEKKPQKFNDSATDIT
jgi:hypothetical protein